MRTRLLLVLLLGSCSAAAAPPGPPAEVRCDLLSLDTSDEPAVASFRVSNGSGARISYRGYEAGAPLYTREVLQHGVWEASLLGWCGTGLTEHVLEPGQALDFEANVPADGRSYRFAFGEPAVLTPPVSVPPK